MSRTVSPLSSIFIAIILFGTGLAHAQDSLQNANAASRHASKAAILGTKASGQAALGVAAVPLLSVGAVGAAIGEVSTAAGKGAAAAAVGRSSGPLPVSDETITVRPPDQALQSPAISAER